MASAALRANAPYGSARDLEALMGHSIGNRPVHAVFVGAHPDDPETGCGGTIAKLTGDGHQVTMLYLTRGEAGIKDGDTRTTASVRTEEAERAAAILQARAVFANQIDGQTSADGESSSHFTTLLASLRPDIVFSHWPDDTHKDHGVVAELTRLAWETLEHSFCLAYYEVMAGIQTCGFKPDVFVDVTSTESQKRAAVYAHKSQNPDRFYPHHVAMELQRGIEARLARAEAFALARERPKSNVVAFPSLSRR